MLAIKILGPGCYNCQLLAQMTAQALESLSDGLPAGTEATIVKVTEVEEIRRYPIKFTPGLVINEKLVCAGRIPAVEEIKRWLNQALQAG